MLEVFVHLAQYFHGGNSRINTPLIVLSKTIADAHFSLAIPTVSPAAHENEESLSRVLLNKAIRYLLSRYLILFVQQIF